MSLQLLDTILLLSFGSLAVRTAVRLAPPHEDRPGWLIVGAAFSLIAWVMVIQDIWGISAMVAGEGSETWNTYLVWAPAFNHSRTFALMAADFALLTWVGLPRTSTGRMRWFGPGVALGAGLLWGGWVGWEEGPLRESVHYPAVVILDAAELIILLTTLFVLLVRNRVDRLLWFALAAYAFNLALNSLSGPVLVRLHVAESWHPPGWVLHVHRVLLAAVMVHLAWRRLALARAGRAVPTLYGTLH